MTSTTKYEEFRDMALDPLVNTIKSYYPIEEFEKHLQILYESIVAEARGNFQDYQRENENHSIFFDGLLEKITELRGRIFKEEPNGIYHIRENVQINNTDSFEAIYATLIYKEVNKITKLFKTYADKTYSQLRFPYNIAAEQSTETISYHQNEVNETGFKAKNPRNLYRVWEALRNKDNNFISSEVTFNNFERAFIGFEVKTKIVWSANDKCLHYFIDGIYGKPPNYGIGVEELEKGKGQWKKASGIFIKKDGAFYNPENLSRTKDPLKVQKDKLSPIITQLNKPPKIKD